MSRPGPSTRTPAQHGRERRGEARSAATVDHSVKPGESLWSIAEHHFGDGARYKEIAELNRDLLGARPSFLEPGWVLKLPAAGQRSASNTDRHAYTVQAHDTLSDIAHDELGDADRWPEIYQASTGITQPGGAHLADPDVIDVGWKLNIPGSPDSPPGTTTGSSSPSLARTSPRPPPSPRTEQQPIDPPAEETPPVPETEVPETEAPEAAAPEVPQAEGPTAPAADVDQVDEADDSILEAPWVLAGLTGGGVLLSGALLMALRSRRRSAYRNRPPGRAIAAPPPSWRRWR